jgi:DNA-binding transcriptional regulator of glucitol operon
VKSAVATWWSPRAIGLHVAMVCWVAGCGLAAWWQVGRALQGNQFSYLYAVEWPVFGGAGIFCWWALLHSRSSVRDEAPESDAVEERAHLRARLELRARDEEDAELAAYNDYLAELAVEGKKKGWRG